MNGLSAKGTDHTKGGSEHLEEVWSTWEWYRATMRPCCTICWKVGPRRMLLHQEHSLYQTYPSCAMESPSCTMKKPCWAMEYVIAPSMALLRHACYCCAKVMMLLQPRSYCATLDACCAIMVQDGPFWFLDESWYPWWAKYAMKSSMLLRIVQGCSEVGIAQGLHHVVPP